MRSVLFAWEERVCRTDRKYRASIPAAVCLWNTGRSIVTTIKRCIPNTHALQVNEDTPPHGIRRAEHTFVSIRYARSAWGREDTRRQPWWIISSRTVGTRTCSGTEVTGRACANRATIKRQGVRTVCRHIVTFNRSNPETANIRQIYGRTLSDGGDKS